ncbi:hypothetical protein [Sulfobacillus harzensis]|uniref:ABC-2 type transporter domain-containing protein n=1 Tax=Sulfobacillus harzensis TaxID=2729629 RepID=A0A7Y0L1R2_9FIRM|nr:hypothetical protein [Sulfobacillus harzensis]NMP21687.1 hypothetical protein [Sulfobacillus harzensis]
MRDLSTMLWKEFFELFGNQRFLRIFALVVLAFGILPTLSTAHHHGSTAVESAALVTLLRALFVLFATVVMVSQTAPDMVLHERVGHTLDYLLTTRLPEWAIFGAKVLISSLVGYVAAILSMGVQLLVAAALSGNGLHWLFLATGTGRLIALAFSAGLALYTSIVGTFVALRVGDQRAAYLVTMLSVAILLVPFFLGWLHVHLTLAWLSHAAIIFGIFTVALGIVGLKAFRRHMLVLYLQE